MWWHLSKAKHRNPTTLISAGNSVVYSHRKDSREDVLLVTRDTKSPCCPIPISHGGKSSLQTCRKALEISVVYRGDYDLTDTTSVCTGGSM